MMHQKILQERTLFRRFPKDYNMAAEGIMSSEHDYVQALLKLKVRQTRLNNLKGSCNNLVTYRTIHEKWKCHNCGKKGHIAKK